MIKYLILIALISIPFAQSDCKDYNSSIGKCGSASESCTDYDRDGTNIICLRKCSSFGTACGDDDTRCANYKKQPNNTTCVDCNQTSGWVQSDCTLCNSAKPIPADDGKSCQSSSIYLAFTSGVIVILTALFF